MFDKASDYTDMLYEASDTIKDIFSKTKDFIKQVMPDLIGFASKWILFDMHGKPWIEFYLF